jgi:flavin reductase (DIM6/NTAB) family NADH-FMN oxidoreductase RutF
MKIEMAKLNPQESHDLIGSAIAPLPVTLISTIGQDGTHNAAPYSFVAPVCSKPALVCVSFGMRRGQKKDTLRNIELSRDFVVNVVDEKLIDQAVEASGDYPSNVDEIKKVGLTALKSERVKSPRIAEAKVSLECRLVQKLEIPDGPPEAQTLRAIVIGEIILAHVKDDVWLKGSIDPSRLRAVGRVGTDRYCKVQDTFEIKRPELK